MISLPPVNDNGLGTRSNPPQMSAFKLPTLTLTELDRLPEFSLDQLSKKKKKKLQATPAPTLYMSPMCLSPIHCLPDDVLRSEIFSLLPAAAVGAASNTTRTWEAPAGERLRRKIINGTLFRCPFPTSLPSHPFCRSFLSLSLSLSPPLSPSFHLSLHLSPPLSTSLHLTPRLSSKKIKKYYH